MALTTTRFSAWIRTYWPLCLLLALFGTGVLSRAFFVDFSGSDYGSHWDHFFFSTTAKNIAAGLGWSSSGFETYPGNPYTRFTGPTIILPISLSIGIFGNGLAVPTVTMALMNLGLLTWLSLLLCQRYPGYRGQVTMALLLLAFSAFYPHYWYRAMGEIPVVLLLMISAFHLVNATSSTDRFRLFMLLGGLTAGLAVAAKTLAMLAVIGLWSAWVIAMLCKNRSGWRPVVLGTACFCLPLILPYAAFGIYLSHLNSTLDPHWASQTIDLLKRGAPYHAGISQALAYLDPATPIWETVKTTSLHSTTVLSELFTDSWLAGIALPIALLFLFVTITAAAFAWRYDRLPVLLLAAAMPILLWLLLLAPNPYPRYLLTLLFCCIASAVIAIAQWHAMRWQLLAWGLVASLIIGLSGSETPTGSRQSTGVQLSLRWLNSPSDFAVDTQALSQYLEARGTDKVGILTTLPVYEPEYLSQRHNVFFNFSDFIADNVQLDESRYRADYPEVDQAIRDGRYTSAFDHFTHPQTPQHYTAPVNITGDGSAHLLMAKYNRPDILLPSEAICPDIVFQNRHFLIQRCTVGDMHRFLLPGDQLNFRPMKWVRPRIILPHDHGSPF